MADINGSIFLFLFLAQHLFNKAIFSSFSFNKAACNFLFSSNASSHLSMGLNVRLQLVFIPEALSLKSVNVFDIILTGASSSKFLIASTGTFSVFAICSKVSGSIVSFVSSRETLCWLIPSSVASVSCFTCNIPVYALRPFPDVLFQAY
jgi:hypothetical protein